MVLHCSPGGESIAVDATILSQIAEGVRRLDERLSELDRKLSPATKQYLAVEEFAQLVGRSPYTVRAWLKSGKIRGERVTGSGPRGRWLIPRDQLKVIVNSGEGASIPSACV